MNTARSAAYRRVMRTLRDLGPAKLSASEQACIRDAADALIFSRTLDDEEARDAFVAVAAMADVLVDADRWTRRRTEQLLEDLWCCGPGAPHDASVAA